MVYFHVLESWEPCKYMYTYIMIIFFSFINDTRVRVVAFNATFNNMSAISWRSLLLMEENWVHEENHRPAASHWQALSHYVASSTPCHKLDSNSIATLVMIGTDCTGSCKPNCHPITTTAASQFVEHVRRVWRYQRVIRILKSKKNKKHNGQKKKYKRTNNDLQNLHTKLKIA